MTEKSDRHKVAEAEKRGRAFARTARPCAVCGQPVATRGRSMHYSCDPDHPLAGMICSCRNDCTRTLIGDGPVACDPACVVCSKFKGRTYQSVRP